MARIRFLAHPPINEAVIDVQFSASSVGRTTLDTLAESYTKAGWEKLPLTTYEAKFGTSAEEPTAPIGLQSSTSQFAGFLIRQATTGRHLQFRSDRLAVSQSGNYTKWESLEDDMGRAFTDVRAVISPNQITRVAARYINRLPLPSNDFQEFAEMLTEPPLPPSVFSGSVVTDFSVQRIIKNIDDEFTAILNILTVQPLQGESVNAVAIDIDVFTDRPLDPTFVAVKAKLARIRAIKNELFFGSLTEKALEKY